MILMINKPQAMAAWDLMMNATYRSELKILSQDTSGNIILEIDGKQFKLPVEGGHKDITPIAAKPMIARCPVGCGLTADGTPCAHGWVLMPVPPEVEA